MADPARRPFPYRRLFWKWHLYAGLFGTPLLILIAVTGAILVFSPEIDHALRPDLWVIQPPTASQRESRSDQALLEGVRTRFPESRILQYRQNDVPEKPYQLLLITPGIKGLHDVWMNPYTGEMVGERARETSFVRIVEQLHRRLLTGEIGSSIIELITGWAIVLSLTGLCLWWPRTLRQLKQGLSLTRTGGAYKVNWRLHNAVGGWTAVLILLLAVTGMVFSTFSGAMYGKLMSATGGERNPLFRPPKSTASPGSGPASLDPMLAQIRREAGPDVRCHVLFPGEKDGSVVFTDLRSERPAWSGLGDFRIWAFDQFDGQLLQRSGWDDLHPLFQFRFLSLVIHFGSICGPPTKILAVVACLAIPVLAVTGFLIWWWKRRRQSGRAASEPASPASDPTKPVSPWIVAVCLVIALVFPTIGASFLVLVAWEWVSRFFVRRLSVAAT